MENKFYQDNLEYFLKEQADNFRMYPSRKVWHGIYNDLHPSRKWPSLIIWALLISSIAYIGFTNKSHVSDRNTQLTSSVKSELNVAQAGISERKYKIASQANYKAQKNTGFSVNSSLNSKDLKTAWIKTKEQEQGKPDQFSSVIKKQLIQTNIDLANQPGASDQSTGSSDSNENPVTKNDAGSIDIFNPQIEKEVISVSPNAEKAKVRETKKSIPADEFSVKTDKEWIEDFAFHNKVPISKWKSNTSLSFYFTPSVGYRSLSINTNYSPSSASLVAPISNNQDYKKALSQVAAINMELGSSIIFSYSKNWNIKAGIQFNYTNYAINAYELKHPTMTTVMLNDLNNGYPYLDPRSTNLANSVGVSSKKLNNNTYQVSLPFGADLKLAGKNKLKLYAGATIQPTFIIGGNAFLISSDLKNYVTDKSLMRKWNLNAGFETFLSYKTLSGITINAGPQFRYQILSTYDNQYTYDENLYNFGLKIGIITKF